MNKIVAFSCFLYVFSFTVIAQNNQDEPLKTIISNLEKHYNVSFAYLDEDVEAIYISAPPANFTFQEIIQYLGNSTSLKFQVLNERFITICKPPEILREVNGVIIDGQTGSMINGATIQAKNRFTISDEKGNFRFDKVNIGDTLLVRCLGYEYSNTPVSEFLNDPINTIRLRQQIQRLKEVVITNFITQGIDKEADGTIVIRSETLDILPGLTEPDVLQTIQALPGIMSIDETVSDINVRGGTDDQNLILWNGIRMYQSGHFFGLISAFNPFITREVGLIKNGSSACLGDAVSSIVNIQTDNRVKQRVSGSAGMNMVNMDINITIPVFKKSSLQFSARRSLADIMQTPTYKSYFERAFRNSEVTNPTDNPDSLLNSNDEFKFYDFSLNYNYNVSSKDKLEFSFLKIYNNIEYRENAFINNDTLTRTSGLKQKSLAAGIVYRRLWNEKLRTNLQLYLSDYKLNAVNQDIFNNQRLIQENGILDKSLKLDSRYFFSDNLNLLAGYQLSEVGIGYLVDINNPDYRRYVKKVLLNHAVFTEANFSSRSGNTRLRSGLRLNYYSKFNKWLIEPRIAFNQKFLDYFSFELLGEFKSQTTTQIIDRQNEFLGVEKRRWILSNNEDIPVITSRQLSTGIHYQQSGILISVEGYIKQVKGIISSSQGFQNQYQYIRSAGDYKVAGLDFLINKRFKHVNTWLSYSLARNDYYFPEFIPQSFPNNLDIRHSLSYGFSFQLRRFQIASGIDWRTGKPYTKPVGVSDDQILYYPANSSRFENYIRLDLSAIYKINFRDKMHGDIGVSVWNFVNTPNTLDVYYQLDDTDEIQEIWQNALSITPNFMFRVYY